MKLSRIETYCYVSAAWFDWLKSGAREVCAREAAVLDDLCKTTDGKYLFEYVISQTQNICALLYNLFLTNDHFNIQSFYELYFFNSSICTSGGICFCKWATTLDISRGPQITKKVVLPLLQPAKTLFRECFRDAPEDPGWKRSYYMKHLLTSFIARK